MGILAVFDIMIIYLTSILNTTEILLARLSCWPSHSRAASSPHRLSSRNNSFTRASRSAGRRGSDLDSLLVAHSATLYTVLSVC